MATLIRADGAETTILPKDPKRGFAFEGELYELLRCEMIEVVHLADGRLMLLDEEGKLRRPRKAANEKATKLLHQAGGSPFDVVLGDVVIAEPGEFR